MKQKFTFFHSEGDAWFDRNHDQLGLYDPVTPFIIEQNIRPTTVLEVGCANGWRLAKFRDVFGCQVVGIDPSMKAAVDGAAKFQVPIHQRSASSLPLKSRQYDMIIYGFCLYLADPDDWLLIASEADHALTDDGHIVIHDFNDWVGGAPFSKPYEHRDGLKSYHYDFAKLWCGHPRYQVISHVDGAHNDGVTILQKNALPALIRDIP